MTSIESKLDEAGAAFGAVNTDGHVMSEWFRDILIGWVPEWISSLFGMGDDYVGQTSHVIFGFGDYDKVNHRWASLPVGTDPDEGRYETYFMAQVVMIPAAELEE